MHFVLDIKGGKATLTNTHITQTDRKTDRQIPTDTKPDTDTYSCYDD